MNERTEGTNEKLRSHARRREQCQAIHPPRSRNHNIIRGQTETKNTTVVNLLYYLDVLEVAGARERVRLVVLLDEALRAGVLGDDADEPDALVEHLEARAHRGVLDTLQALCFEAQVVGVLVAHVQPVPEINHPSSMKSLKKKRIVDSSNSNEPHTTLKCPAHAIILVDCLSVVVAALLSRDTANTNENKTYPGYDAGANEKLSVLSRRKDASFCSTCNTHTHTQNTKHKTQNTKHKTQNQ